MGSGLERSYSKNISFIIIGYNISKLKYQKPLGPYTEWNQDLSTFQNFKRGVLTKKKTLQEPLSVQVDLNRGIKEGLILLLLSKQLMKMESGIHNTYFLISPTMHLFPLAGQSWSRGVSSMITFELKIWNNEKYYQTIQSRMTRQN